MIRDFPGRRKEVMGFVEEGLVLNGQPVVAERLSLTLLGFTAGTPEEARREAIKKLEELDRSNVMVLEIYEALRRSLP
jgi:hypothetical protein